MSRLPSIPFYTKNATVCSMSELTSLNAGVTHLTIGSNCMNENSTVLLHFTRFAQLKELVVGDSSCVNVDQLNLIGLSKLRSVVIGENSFTKKKNGFGKELNRQFYVKNCPSLRELRVGRYSFSDYGACEIENVNALEVIVMGELNQVSNTFYSASLELKSTRQESEIENRLTEVDFAGDWWICVPRQLFGWV